MEKIYLIAGLGNPGTQYVRTRHNVGFRAVEQFAARRQAGWTLDERFNSRVARIEVGGRKVMLSQPQTYMNSSGTTIRALVDYFKIDLARLLVVVDDADLPLGEVRMRPEGGSGGHHGLESVEHHLSAQDYPRLRIGIGRLTSGVREITGHVLGKFRPDEQGRLDQVLDTVVNQIECWLSSGIQKAMNEFNGAVESPMPKES